MKPSASFLRAKNARDALPASMPVSTPVGLAACRTKPIDLDQTCNKHESSYEADSGLTADELEQAIADAGDRFIEAAERWEKEGGFGDHAQAQKWWRIQKHLIGLRSKEWVRKVEVERGLV